MNTAAPAVQLPLRIDEITPQWLSAALSDWTPGVRVADIEEMIVIPGTATKIRLKLRYAEPAVRNGPPTTLCIKGGFDEALRGIVAEAYQLEANFFAQVAKTLSMPLPRCWYAGTDLEHGQGIIVLEDLVAAGATFGDPLTPWSVDVVAAALEVLAQLHGQTWGATAERFPCLQNGSWVRTPTEVLLGEANWQRAFGHDEGASLPAPLRDRKRVHQAVLAMWHHDDREGIPCLSHADPHIGNTYLQADGKPRFLDWQVACLAPGNDDAAYFIAGALNIDDRRSEERHLLKHYLDAVAGYGGPRQRFDPAWLDYRRHQMHGFLWAVTPPEMQSPARVAAMGERHIAAIIDHETLALLRR